MYDVTITNCETLEMTHKRVENPLEVLNGIEWLWTECCNLCISKDNHSKSRRHNTTYIQTLPVQA